MIRGAARRRAIPSDKASIAPYVNRIVSDAILFNELPSPTPGEARRTGFIVERLLDFGYPEPSVDDIGNVSVLIPSATGSDDCALLFADIASDDYSPIDCIARLEENRVYAKGIAENSIGVAALMVLGEYLARNAIHYDMNVLLLWSSFDPGARETQPLERFIQDWKARLRFAAYVRGIVVGRTEMRPMGTYKLSVSVRTPEREVAFGGPAVSAISVLADIAFRLGGIRWDSENATFLNIARIEAGVGFGWHPAEGALELEIFSSDRNALEVAKNAVTATIGDISTETGAGVDLAVKAFFPAGDTDINSRLNEILRGVHEKLKIRPVPTSIPDHSAFIKSLAVPAISLGVTTGKRGFQGEYIDIRPVETGFRQILQFLEESTRAGREPEG